jgi:hypothetical protein
MSKPAWNTITLATPALAKRMDAVRDLQKKLADERRNLETQVTAKMRKDGVLKAGETAIFAYRFGKMAFAIVSEAEAKAPKAAATPKFTF